MDNRLTVNNLMIRLQIARADAKEELIAAQANMESARKRLKKAEVVHALCCTNEFSMRRLEEAAA